MGRGTPNLGDRAPLPKQKEKGKKNQKKQKKCKQKSPVARTSAVANAQRGKGKKKRTPKGGTGDHNFRQSRHPPPTQGTRKGRKTKKETRTPSSAGGEVEFGGRPSLY